jgi:hypothetical protein
MKLIEKDYDSEMNNDWKWVDGAPSFDSHDEALAWLKEQGIEHFDHYRLI